MNLYSLFPTAIAKFELGREFTPEEIAFIENQPVHKNTANTVSDSTTVLKHWSMSKLREFTESCVAEYLKAVYAPKHEVSLQVTQSWLNYTKPGEHHHKHDHSNSFVSGVLYIKASKERDKIYFYKDTYQQIKIKTDNWNMYNSESWWFEAAAGELILFPSHLAHKVETVQEEERVSLAFNTFPVGHLGDEQELTYLHL
jgi:uncharacterized protein (TIGR02466 family)